MARKETIKSKNGLWSMMRTFYEDDDDLTEMSRCPTTRELLEKIRAEAVEVLAVAGYPTKPGRYFQSGSKQYERIERSEKCPDLLMQPGLQSGRFIEWPFFTEIERLTIEDFAASLIYGIDRVLRAFDEDIESHTLADLMVLLIYDYHPFRVERDAIGTAAEAGERAQRSITGARQTIHKRSDSLKALITKHKTIYCKKYPKQAENKSSIASGIRVDVIQDMREAGYSNYDISVGRLRKYC